MRPMQSPEAPLENSWAGGVLEILRVFLSLKMNASGILCINPSFGL